VKPAWVDLDAEAKRQFFEDLVEKLWQGSRQEGATLTPAECKELLVLVRTRPPVKRGRGRVVDAGDRLRAIGMALNCNARVHAGAFVKDAVAATAQVFGVSKATVRAARQQYK
jgi:hypothetical protein